MKSTKDKQVRVIVPHAALETIFDECDRFDSEETGGRIIGTYHQADQRLTIKISGIIEPGPKARRTAVSFFQDGDFQENIFRQIERVHPEIEHLGNWHTHHMNGLQTLSIGDVTTYRRIVQHPNHNVPFFYAFLVVAKRSAKEPNRRYDFKHFILFRDEEDVYEIPDEQMESCQSPLLWPGGPFSGMEKPQIAAGVSLKQRPDRVNDKEFITQFFEGLRSYSTPRLGFYWRGHLELLDRARVQIVISEDTFADTNLYSVVLRDPPQSLCAIAEQLATRTFPSARAALMFTERECNRALFRSLQTNHNVTQTKEE